MLPQRRCSSERARRTDGRDRRWRHGSRRWLGLQHRLRRRRWQALVVVGSGLWHLAPMVARR